MGGKILIHRSSLGFHRTHPPPKQSMAWAQCQGLPRSKTRKGGAQLAQDKSTGAAINVPMLFHFGTHRRVTGGFAAGFSWAVFLCCCQYTHLLCVGCAFGAGGFQVAAKQFCDVFGVVVRCADAMKTSHEPTRILCHSQLISWGRWGKVSQKP